MKKLPMLMVAVLIFAVSCSKNDLTEKKETVPETFTESLIIDGLNRFGFDVLLRLAGENPDNIFYSPLSISSALAMSYAGAAGSTADEIREVLHYGPQLPDFHQRYGALIRALQNSGSENFHVSIANAIWVEKQYKLLDSYLKTVMDHYRSEAGEMDFSGAPESSRQYINQWVSEQTGGRIRDLLPGGSIDAMTRLILTNAVYFNAEWDEQFNENMTRKTLFYPGNGEAFQTDMMYQRHYYPYSETEDFQILEIDYRGDRYSMTVLLPKIREAGADLLKKVNPGMIAVFDSMKTLEDVILYMPKFRMETRYEMSKVLQKMGMSEAFSAKADFSGMSGKKDLMITEVIHKAFIEVDEKKTEAAAATGVVMKLTAIPPAPGAPIVFKADHPFLLLIREKQNKGILFIGWLNKPEFE